MSSNNPNRGGGLGSLLSNPAPTADEDPEYAAHQSRRGGEAEAPAEEPARLPARTSRTTGALATRGAGAVLPRKRTQRVAKEKLTVQIPVKVLDGLTALVERDGTRRYDEVEEALRALLAKKGIELDED